jgi:hypothetical protein
MGLFFGDRILGRTDGLSGRLGDRVAARQGRLMGGKKVAATNQRPSDFVAMVGLDQAARKIS